MDRKKMTYQDAAIQLIQMAATLNSYGIQDEENYEAVAIACGLLFAAQANFGQPYLSPIEIDPTGHDVNTTGTNPL